MLKIIAERIEKRKDEIKNKNEEYEKNKKINLILMNKNNQLEEEIEKKKLEYQQLLNDILEIKKYQKKILESKEIISEQISNDLNDIKYEKDAQLKKDEEQLIKALKNQPILLYNQPTLIGLNNIGATCFMNATLQCLSQTEELSNYFLNEKNLSRIMKNNIEMKNHNDAQLSPQYLILIKELWSTKGTKSYSPYNFRNMVEIMNPLFKEGQAGDSKDFIIFILEQLHKELKLPIQKNILNNLNANQPLNQYDQNNAFIHFFNQFQKETSIISDLFFGFNETNNICQNCKNNCNLKGQNIPICYGYNIFNCLIFPLEEIKNRKNMNMIYFGMQMNQNNRVSINECFEFNQKSDSFTGQNQIYCNLCKQNSDSMYSSRIFINPNILILILNRGKNNVHDVKLDFTEKIDITQFVLQKESPQILYCLYGVITHIGQSGPNAHFIASCKSPVDGKWYRYNDAIVSPITNFINDVLEFGTPYILFYRKINNNTNNK